MPRFQKALAQLMGQEEGGERPQTKDEPDRSGSVLSALRARVSTTELDLLSPFAKTFLQNGRLIEGILPAADIAGMTLGACRFLCDRHTLPVSLRTYAPTTSEHGWSSPHAVLEIATDDQPGLVTAVCGAVEEQGAKIEAILSATVHVERDGTGLAKSIGPATGAADECLIHMQLGGVGNVSDLENTTRRHLEALTRTRREAAPLQVELEHLVDLLGQGADTDREAAELLTWLLDGRFHVAGFQEVDPDDGEPRRSLGVYANPPPGLELGPDSTAAGAICLVKTRARDPLHAGQVIDELRVRPTDPLGTGARIYRIAGTLSGRASREAASGLPLARGKYAVVAGVVASADTQAARDLPRKIFDRLPLDLILAADADDLAALVDGILNADSQPAVRVFITPGPPSGTATTFATIVAPRQQLARSDTDRVSQLVRERAAPILGRHFVSDDLAVARMHYALDMAAANWRPEVVDDLTTQMRRVIASWREAPVAERPRALDTGSERPAQPSPRRPPTSAPPEVHGVEIDPEGTSGRRFLVRVAATGEGGTLNQLVKELDNLGLRILRHGSTRSSEQSEIHEISVEVAGDDPVDGARIAETLRAVRSGAAEIDPLSRLSWRVGLGAASVDILRAFVALAEGRGAVEKGALAQILVENPQVAEGFLRAFEVKFDPRLPVANEAHRRRDVAGVREHIDAAAALVADRNARQALSELGDLLDETVRTSFFCGDRVLPGRAIALKLYDERRAQAPYQTFVRAPAFEGIQLRGGLASRPRLHLCEHLPSLHAAAARDLREQALRSAQVTTDPGSAFVALRASTASAESADRALREFLGALLDVTDDIVNGELQRDRSVIAYDEPDSYFSIAVGERPTGWGEIARQVILERRFWMGDAAVTRYDERVAAEGAWAAQQRLHQSFETPRSAERAADKSPESGPPPMTVVAIGPPDELYLPSGVRLVAALDEHEIFLAPSMDAASCAKALEEMRRRGGSSWSDFPVDLRGPGGSVTRRDSRKVELSEEARKLLAWTEGGGGEELAQAVLAVDVDLLWVRGACARAVGRRETAELTSEQIEVEAARIGAGSVAEIGHALFTPEARVEFALAGGHVHTPAFDCIAADLVADRVSNIELALSLLGASGEIVESQSAEVAAEIRQIAMDVPRRQVVAASLDQARSATSWPATAACLRRLRGDAAAAALDLAVASEPELERRQGTAGGLTRPEVVVSRALVSVQLQREIRSASLCRDPYMRPWIEEYFPTPISRQFPDLVERHPLRDEIAALAVAERILEVMGFSFVAETAATHGHSDLDVVKAWSAAFIFGGAQEVWSEIEAAGLGAGSAEQRHRLSLADALKRATDRMVELRCTDSSLERLIDRFGGPVGEILRAWPEPLPESRQPEHQGEIEAGVQAGLPRDAADHLARITHLADIIDICDLAIQINSPRSAVATAFLGLEPILGWRDIDAMVAAVRHQDLHWGARAEAHLRARLSAARRGLTTEVVSSAAGRRKPIERWIDSHGDAVRTFQRLLGEVKTRGRESSAAVEVLIGALENLARGQRRSR